MRHLSTTILPITKWKAVWSPAAGTERHLPHLKAYFMLMSLYPDFLLCYKQAVWRVSNLKWKMAFLKLKSHNRTLHTPSMSSQHTQSKTIIMQYLLRQLHNTFQSQKSLLPLPVFPSCLAYLFKPLKHNLSIVASSWCTRKVLEVLKVLASPEVCTTNLQFAAFLLPGRQMLSSAEAIREDKPGFHGYGSLSYSSQGKKMQRTNHC